MGPIELKHCHSTHTHKEALEGSLFYAASLPPAETVAVRRNDPRFIRVIGLM